MKSVRFKKEDTMETRKAELLIDEYLQSKNCENTRKAISVKPSTEKNEMMLQNQKSIKPFPSGLEYMVLGHF